MTRRGLAILAGSAGVGLGASMALLLLAQYSEHRHDPHDLLTLTSGSRVQSVAVRDASGRDVWLIRSAEPRPLQALRYGVVPRGYEQSTPDANRAPRLLVAGERLSLAFSTADGMFVHDGIAVDAYGFRGGVSTFTPYKTATSKQ
jgi:hypothetical protein